MKTQEIRNAFLNYFRKEGHALVPSSSVLPHDDPTLLFINAGMNQFKDVFLGKAVRDYVKATSCQKCIRVGGKHNDLENVGHTKRHLTFFEMLGNFSFGDYFKKEAIRFSWEVSTQVFGFEAEKIWPTVFEEDDEAFELWQAYVPKERITRFGAEDNFWAMGETGPCGPCAELYYDRGEKYGKGKSPSEDVDGERFLEFWNLVFMQYNRDESGKMTPLPKPSIDTGAGLERVMSLIQGVDSLFETDIFKMIIQKVETISGVSYDRNDEDLAPAFHVVSDHLRCLAFAISDGVQPSNVERGYVLRKVLRRAVRYGRKLGLDAPFLGQIFPALLEEMGPDYPELEKSRKRIVEILTSEEEAFFRTLRRGGNILNRIIDAATEKGHQISGEDAFKLKDTYGLPLDEILLLAKDSDLSVDVKRYEELEKEARQRSKKAAKREKQEVSSTPFETFREKEGPTEFLGYEKFSCDGIVKGIFQDGSFKDEIREGEEAFIILDRTPFYAEMGGQVGDTGVIRGDAVEFQVSDCQAPFKGVIAHVGHVKTGKLCMGDRLHAEVDQERRLKIQNNHTVTHLLHWALCKVLGEHVKQAGSVLDETRTRFDFSHHKAITQDEINQIEDLVNAKIRENIPVKWYQIPYEEVQTKKEIKQFFGEKYDQEVRVVDINFSKELCGGTHTSCLGNIGYFRIVKEGSIAAGVRRIEAVTGKEAEAFAKESDALIQKASDLLKTDPKKFYTRLEKLVEETNELSKQLKEVEATKREGLIQECLKKVETIHEVPFLSLTLNHSPKEIRTFVEMLLKKSSSLVVVVGSHFEEKGYLFVGMTKDWIKKGWKAGAIIQELSPIIGGKGGGQPHLAQAGGTKPEKIPEALDKARKWVLSNL